MSNKWLPLENVKMDYYVEFNALWQDIPGDKWPVPGRVAICIDPQERLGQETWDVFVMGDGTSEGDSVSLGLFWELSNARLFAQAFIDDEEFGVGKTKDWNKVEILSLEYFSVDDQLALIYGFRDYIRFGLSTSECYAYYDVGRGIYNDMAKLNPHEMFEYYEANVKGKYRSLNLSAGEVWIPDRL